MRVSDERRGQHSRTIFRGPQSPPASEAAVRDAPVADWVTIPDLHDNPFPIYRKMREESPIHWVPAVNRYMVTSYAACHTIEQDAETFSADETGSLMKRSMGHSMLRKDDPEHKVDRDSYGSTLRPGTIKKHWNAIFAANNEKYLTALHEKGPGSDFVWDYAAPYAAENLRLICGFHNASQQDMQRWSQTMIDGTGNYADDPEVWAKSVESSGTLSFTRPHSKSLSAGWRPSACTRVRPRVTPFWKACICPEGPESASCLVPPTGIRRCSRTQRPSTFIGPRSPTWVSAAAPTSVPVHGSHAPKWLRWRCRASSSAFPDFTWTPRRMLSTPAGSSGG